MKRTRVNISGLYFDNVTMNEAIMIMENRIRNNQKDGYLPLLLVANQDTLARINPQTDFNCDNLNKSFLVVPDGFSILAAGKFLKTPLKERIAGPDLMMKFCEISSEKGYSHFFLGSKEEVLEKLLFNLKTIYKDLRIAGIYSPPFCHVFSEEENEKMISLINKAKPDIVWVSFGCPKQETWILQNHSKINSPIIAGIGAAFDFHSGFLKRAPLWMQKIGMEWFFRFLQEPDRLWKRYFIGGLFFIKLIIQQKRKKK